jgi:hypothetical protein
MRAEAAAGNLAGVHETWRRCVSVIAEVAADGKPEPATAQLYVALIGSPARYQAPRRESRVSR